MTSDDAMSVSIAVWMLMRLCVCLAVTVAATVGLTMFAQSPAPDWSSADVETLQHFQALVRMDTSDPPGNELPAASYLEKVLRDRPTPASSAPSTTARSSSCSWSIPTAASTT